MTQDMMGSQSNRPARTKDAFTLIEMILVLVIVLILMGLVLPASRELWDKRKMSIAQNTLRGVLLSARAEALRLGASERGLFFYLDQEGVQRIVPIERDGQEPQTCTPQPGCQAAWQNVFRVLGEDATGLPTPIRVVPRYVVDEVGDKTMLFSDEELANNNVDVLPGDANQAQRHRNFFTIVFSNDGSLLVRRDVLIVDPDADSDMRGDVTGLTVGYKPDDPPTGPTANVQEYYRQDDKRDWIDVTNPGTGQAVLFPAVDADNIALNFPSVDGLMVYDDSAFQSVETPEAKRAVLLETAQPYYVNRLTGAIVRGPAGENVAP